jgi:hypothetical protein
MVAEKFMMNYDEIHTNTFMQGFVEKISGNEFKYS